MTSTHSDRSGTALRIQQLQACSLTGTSTTAVSAADRTLERARISSVTGHKCVDPRADTCSAIALVSPDIDRESCRALRLLRPQQRRLQEATDCVDLAN